MATQEKKRCQKVKVSKQARYKAQFARTDKNKRLTLARHIRHFPDDGQAFEVWGARSYTTPTSLDPVARARRLIAKRAKILLRRSTLRHANFWDTPPFACG